jgi:hypothetical protein
MPGAAAIYAQRAPRFERAQDGYGTGMSNPDDTTQAATEDERRQESGEREQGVRTEDSEDLSSPQLTEDADDRR